MVAVPSQTEVFADTDAGVDGSNGVRVIHTGVPLPQVLLGVTHTVPLLHDPNDTVIEFVPCPVEMLAPDGTVQLYEFPVTLGTE